MRAGDAGTLCLVAALWTLPPLGYSGTFLIAGWDLGEASESAF